MIIEVTKDNPIVAGQTLALLDFYADWCGPCKMTAKYLEEYIEENPELTIYKINVDEFPEIAEQYQVLNLPTILCVSENEVLWRHTGLMTKQKLVEKLC